MWFFSVDTATAALHIHNRIVKTFRWNMIKPKDYMSRMLCPWYLVPSVTTGFFLAILVSHKHFPLLSNNHLSLEHSQAFTMAYMQHWLGTHHLCVVFASISHHILPIWWATLATVSEVTQQQACGDTSSGDRKWTGKWVRKWQLFHLHLAAGFDLNFTSDLTTANIWDSEQTWNSDMTCRSFIPWLKWL